MPSPQPIDRAAAFEPEELFFSTTDRSGRITACNDVFVRIASYPSEELLGAPHNLIRHPDMPRAVFRLLWQYLLAGRPIGAYVKNMTAEGEYYWVFALALPIEGGFLSIRLKPTTATREAVEGLYREMLVIEGEHAHSPEAGMDAAAARLVEVLGSLGFASYDEFMVASLRGEIASRREIVHGERGTGRLSGLERVFGDLPLLDQLRDGAAHNAASLQHLGRSIQRIALNAGACAARLAARGSALGVLSSETGRISDAVRQEASALEEEQARLAASLHETAFQVSFLTLVNEVVTCFHQQSAASQLSREEQRTSFGATFDELSELLGGAMAGALERASAGTRTLKHSLECFGTIADGFSKILMTTHISNVSGRTLAATTDGGESFALLLEELVDVAERARAELEDLRKKTDAVTHALVDWSFERAAA